MGRMGCWRALLLLVLFAAGPVSASELRILYAEDISMDRAPGSGSASFVAYGQQFDLELEPNSRLLSALPAAHKTMLGKQEILRGRISGMPGSWVRLTTDGHTYRGAIWDGRELYAIEAAGDIVPFMVDPAIAGATGTLVYRLSDAELPLSNNACTVLDRTGRKAFGGERGDTYLKLVQELQATVAQVPTGTLELAAIGDFELFTRTGGNPAAEILAQMNIVDGIFGEQVGVTIALAELQTFHTSVDPFTTSNAEALLDQVSAHRQNTPAIRDRGLAHLWTGRDLDGETAGVAYLDALCDVEFGVGLTEGWLGALTSALVAAHEVGHNFGAPHDAEGGSPCASTPPSFLMAPTINNSSTFSQCSLDQMRPRVAAAACITAVPISDVGLSVPADPVLGFVGIPIAYPIDVASVGTADATAVVLVATFGSLSAVGANVPGGACTLSSFNEVRCELGTIPAGETRRVAIELSAMAPTDVQSIATVTSTNDRNLANNAVAGRVIVSAAADARVILSSNPVTGFTREPMEFTVTVASLGAQAVDNVEAIVNVSAPFTVELVSAPGGACVTDRQPFRCSYPTLAPGETRVITIRTLPTRQGRFQGTASVTASNDGNSFNNVQVFSLEPRASNDVGIEVPQGLHVAIVDTPVPLTATVRSIGPQGATNVLATFNGFSQLLIESASVAGVPCPAGPNDTVVCALGDMPGGTQQNIDIIVRSQDADHRTLDARVSATLDDNTSNDSQQFRMDVRHDIDVALTANFDYGVYETREAFLTFQIRSRGANAASQVTGAVDLPDGVAIVETEMTGGSCTITGRAVRCLRPTLEPNVQSNVLIRLRGLQVGTSTVTITVDAAGDGNPANDTATGKLTVLPFIDAGLDPMPPLGFHLIDDLIEVPVTLRTSVQPISGATFEFQTAQGLDIESADVPGGTCNVTAHKATCTFGTLPAQSAVVMTMGVRAAAPGPQGIDARVSVAQDNDFVNNIRSTFVTVDPRGDATIEHPSATFSALVNEQLTYRARVVAVGSATVHAAELQLVVPVDIEILSASSEGGLCTVSGGNVACVAGDIFGGQSREISLLLRSAVAGSLPFTPTVSARNDVNPQNNSASATVQFSSPTNSPGPPANGGGSSGGGGGSVSLWLLFTLSLSWIVAIRRRTSA